MLFSKKSSKNLTRFLPQPSGSYAVGCLDIMTLQSSLSLMGVFFRLFYPCNREKNAKPPDWLPDARYLEGYAIFFKVWSPLFCKYFPKFVGDVYVPAAWNAIPLKIENKKHPVIVFSHGLGGCRTSYTTLCLELASNGFVVAAIEHRDYSASNSFYFLKNPTPIKKEDGDDSSSVIESQQKPQDFHPTASLNGVTKHWMLMRKVKQGKGEYVIRNKQVHHRAKECSAVLDVLKALNSGKLVNNVLDSESSVLLQSFQGLLDTDNATVAGHSFGGATVISTLALDKRFCAGVGLDTWMLPLREETSLFQKVEQPILFINMEKFQTKPNLTVMKKMESNQTERTIVTLKGTVHLNQCDVPFLCDQIMRRLFGAHSKLDRFVAMDLTTRLAMEFFRKHTGRPSNHDHREYIRNHEKILIKGI